MEAANRQNCYLFIVLCTSPKRESIIYCYVMHLLLECFLLLLLLLFIFFFFGNFLFFMDGLFCSLLLFYFSTHIFTFPLIRFALYCSCIQNNSTRLCFFLFSNKNTCYLIGLNLLLLFNDNSQKYRC